ncbi:MAG: sigma-54 dependent transcriptional regulator, partial [Verrucomicrobiota bacterium]
TKLFENSDTRILSVADGDQGRECIESEEFDAVIAEFRLEGMGGLPLVKETKSIRPNLPVIIVAGTFDSRTAIEVVKAGAFDFLPKPLDTSDLRRSITDAVECSRRSKEAVVIDPTPAQADTNGVLIGKSRSMLRVYTDLGRLSPTPVTVLITGETGTGKELIATALYQHGHRSHKPLITLNCAAIPENLLESELFGHEKGAFTGATHTRVGKFEQAHDATLFLDEIGDLDLSLQSKLLRVLQEKRFQRVGGSSEISVDVRIIAATHRDLKAMVEEGTFREDLFYRLNVGRIELPALRERKGDVKLLVQYFLQRFTSEFDVEAIGVTPEALDLLEEYQWPGNVRQLQNIIRKAALSARGYGIDAALVKSLLDREAQPGDTSSSHESLALSSLIKESLDQAGDAHAEFIQRIEPIFLKQALTSSKGNLSEMSRVLGLSR